VNAPRSPASGSEGDGHRFAKGEIGLHELDRDTGFGPQPNRQIIEAREIARGQRRVEAAPRQSVGIGRADAGGGAGNQGDAACRVLVHVQSPGSGFASDDRESSPLHDGRHHCSLHYAHHL